MVLVMHVIYLIIVSARYKLEISKNHTPQSIQSTCWSFGLNVQSILLAPLSLAIATVVENNEHTYQPKQIHILIASKFSLLRKMT